MVTRGYESNLEQEILKEASGSRYEALKHVEFLGTIGQRLVGSSEIEKAIEYIKGELDEYGIDNEVLEFDAYVSIPESAELQLLSPEEKTIETLAFSGSATTPAEGIEGELVYAGGGGEERYKNINAKGKIVLADQSYAPFMAEKVRFAEKYGAIGVILANWGKPEHRFIGMGVASSVWGNPTDKSIGMMPHLPVVSITNADGKSLKEQCQSGTVRVKVKATAPFRWVKAHELVATIKGTSDSEMYVLVSGHLDAWGAGTTCNATGDALILELARVLSKYRKELKRSVKFAWWVPHENLYNGSTWFVDNYWDDLNRNLIAVYNVDSPGLKGTTLKHYMSRTFSEIRTFQEKVIKDTLGIDVTSIRWPHKTADASFWGLGAPNVYEKTDFPPEVVREMAGATLGWWYHSLADTPDKCDPELLEAVLKARVISVLRLCNSPIIPFEFSRVGDEFISTLVDLQSTGGRVLDLQKLIEQAKKLKNVSLELESALEQRLKSFDKLTDEKTQKNYEKFNEKLLKLCRILDPILYTYVGKYDQDLAAASYLGKPIPVLQEMAKLLSLDPGSGEFKLLKTRLVRERNKVSDALDLAIDILNDMMEKAVTLKG